MSRLASVLVVASILGSSGCGSAPTGAVLQREWTANAEFAGDVMASQRAPNHSLTLDVREGSDVIDPIKLVRTGDVQFGVASADRILRENEGGAELIILATACYRSPVVFLTHPSSGIKSPADFRGKTVGIQSGTNTELVYKSVTRAHNLAPAEVKTVESGWGTSSFETNALDVLAAFAYDEPVQLDMKSIPYEIIEPETSGIRFVGTVYFTSAALVQDNPKLVQSFMNALVDGWTQALAHPDDAIAQLKQRFTSVDVEKEKRSLARGRVFFSGEGGRLLYASRDRWEEMGRHLIDLGAIKAFDFQSHIDYRFLETALSSASSK